jgi:GNAT superfamily N-acetyltransferase
MKGNPFALTLRTVTPADRELLYRIYASTREEELAIVPFSAQEKHAFLRMQFGARERAYAERFPPEDHLIVEVDSEPAGYFWVHRQESELRLVDVALLPEHRGLGVGTELMTTLIAEARDRHLPVRLNVLATGTARSFYERFGFTAVGTPAVYQLMELLP